MKSLDTPQLNLVSETPLNAETPLKTLNEKITPNDLFYVRNHFDVPEAQAETWKLNVTQGVSFPQQFSLKDLKALPTCKLTVLMECAGNGRSTLSPPIKGTAWGLGAVSLAEFVGTPLHHLLEIVQPSNDSIEVLFTGADQGKVRTGHFTSYARSLTLEMANHPDVLLAWEMNGEVLPSNHGYPLRLIVPNWYGMASVKWLNQISLINKPFDGFFQTGDYVFVDAEGIQNGTPVRHMLVRSLILNPTAHSEHSSRSIEVNGIAWSGEGRIVDVSISHDDGKNWHPTTLETPEGSYSWTRWKRHLTLDQAGKFTLSSRATDSNGNVQPLKPLWNRGGYGNNPVHQVLFSVG
jgi:DMSO/TMAO reductase YedYZ molybdopterin-dependent catalytic subunit